LLNYLQNHKSFLIYYPLIIYWGVLLFFTSLPGADFPDLSVSDKIEHILAFWGLAILLKLALIIQNKYSNLKKHSSLYTLLIIGTYAALDELHQLYIPGRSCDILDWTADISGALLAVLLISLIIKYSSSKLVE